MRVEILTTRQALATAAAENFVTLAAECIQANGRFNVALTGGTTPKDAYELLGTASYRKRVDWSRVQLFWGDERCVPPDDKDSNYGMVRAALLRHIDIPEANVHRMRGEADPAAAAEEYESVIKRVAGERFDLIHLGMGANAHIMSLFPHSSLLHETKRLVAAQYVEEVHMWRITMTPRVIRHARRITFIVAGPDKAAAVASVLEGALDPDELPAQIAKPERGEVLWLLDSAAASGLTKKSS